MQPASIYDGLASVNETNLKEGLLYGLGNDRRALGLLAGTVTDGKISETGYYEMGDKLELVRKEDNETADFIRSRFAIPRQAIIIENSSVLIVDDNGRRWRLPLGNETYKSLQIKETYVFVVKLRQSVICLVVWEHSMNCRLRMRMAMQKSALYRLTNIV